MDETEWLSPQEVREWLKISRSKAAQLCAEEVPSYRVGKLVRVKRTDLEAYLTAHRHEPVPDPSSSAR